MDWEWGLNQHEWMDAVQDMLCVHALLLLLLLLVGAVVLVLLRWGLSSRGLAGAGGGGRMMSCCGDGVVLSVMLFPHTNCPPCCCGLHVGLGCSCLVLCSDHLRLGGICDILCEQKRCVVCRVLGKCGVQVDGVVHIPFLLFKAWGEVGGGRGGGRGVGWGGDSTGGGGGACHGGGVWVLGDGWGLEVARGGTSPHPVPTRAWMTGGHPWGGTQGGDMLVVLLWDNWRGGNRKIVFISCTVHVLASFSTTWSMSRCKALPQDGPTGTICGSGLTTAGDAVTTWGSG